MASSNKRGRAYQCLRCLHRTGKEFIDAKYRVEHHILKHHLGLDEVPYYCTLCLFRCQRRQELDDHVRSYKRHHMLMEEKGILDDSPCLIVNSRPYVLGERDILTLSQQESAAHWAKRQRRGDVLTEAVNQIFPDGLLEEPMSGPPSSPVGSMAMSTPVRGEDTSTETFIHDRTRVLRPQGVQQDGTSAAAVGAQPDLLEQISKLVGGSVLQSLMGLTSSNTAGNVSSRMEQGQENTVAVTPRSVPLIPVTMPPGSPRTGTPARASQATVDLVATPSASHRTAQDLMSPVLRQQPLTSPKQATIAEGPVVPTQPIPSPAKEEDLLAELLPDEDRVVSRSSSSTRKRSPTPDSPPAKRARMESPGASAVPDLGEVTGALKRLREELIKSSDSIRREIEKNSRAVRCMERSIQDLTKVTERLAGVMEREARRRDRQEEAHHREDRGRSRERRGLDAPRQQPEEPGKLKSVIGEVKGKRAHRH